MGQMNRGYRATIPAPVQPPGRSNGARDQAQGGDWKAESQVFRLQIGKEEVQKGTYQKGRFSSHDQEGTSYFSSHDQEGTSYTKEDDEKDRLNQYLLQYLQHRWQSLQHDY